MASLLGVQALRSAGGLGSSGTTSSFTGDSVLRSPCGTSPVTTVGFGPLRRSGGQSIASPSSCPSSPRFVANVAASYGTQIRQDCYHILGIRRGASRSDIKIAYRRLVIKYHPDLNKGESTTAKMAEITRAYEEALANLAADEMEYDCAEGMMGVGDDHWEYWEEWMGWEGAGTYDYSNHIVHP